VDPFDSYSILKPTEMNWLLPKPTRRPLIAVALMGLILIGGVFAFSDANEWPDIPTAAVDFVKTRDGQPNAPAAETRPKPEKPPPAGNRVLTSGKAARTSPREGDRKAQSRKTDKRNANGKTR
jgi:hypothetical protein